MRNENKPKRDHARHQKRRLGVWTALAALALVPAVGQAHESDGSRPTQAVAVEGQVAPGTGGQRFDPAGPSMMLTSAPMDGIGDVGFEEPRVNEDGNVAFIASYGHVPIPAPALSPLDLILFCPGAGVFGWDKTDDALFPIAISGQLTPVGILPEGEDNYVGLTFNDKEQVAFAVRNIAPLLLPNSPVLEAPAVDGPVADGPVGPPLPHNALFEGRKTTPLKVLAKSGDHVPGGGFFDDFYGVSMNQRGDVAFLASYWDLGGAAGVFLKRQGKDVEAIARSGELLPDTGGGRLCTETLDGLEGPWINDDGVVLFQAYCIRGGVPGLQGSIFMKRPHHSLERFVLIGDPVAGGGFVRAIWIGEPGVNNQEAAMRIQMGYEHVAPNVITPVLYPEEVVATKKLDGHHKPAACASLGDDLGFGFQLGYFEGAPTIDRDDQMGFVGVAAQALDPYHVVFTCKDDDLQAWAVEGDPKPVPGGATYGELGDESNGCKHIVWVDETRYPTGVFTTKTHR